MFVTIQLHVVPVVRDPDVGGSFFRSEIAIEPVVRPGLDVASDRDDANFIVPGKL